LRGTRRTHGGTGWPRSKHAYLAACLHLREIPTSGHARPIRGDLLAARDATKPDELPDSAIANSVGMARSFATPQGPPLALMNMPSLDSNGCSEAWISLAGTMAVQWALDQSPV
jgi:hypothetical protein